MRVFIFSVCLALGLTAGLYGYDRYLNATCASLVSGIDEMDKAARAEDWEAAKTALFKVKDMWEKTVPTLALFTDHALLDDVMQTIAEAEGYLVFSEPPEFMAETETLRAFIEHIPKREALTFYNIF